MQHDKARKEFLALMMAPRTRKEWEALLEDLLTPQEREVMEERWQLVQLLAKGIPQRTIAKKLPVSIAKITRGSRVLQSGKGGFLMALERLKGV